VTDHRIELTLYQLEETLNGRLEALIEPLQQEHQSELLGEDA
jgi:peptide chain release factor 1